MLALTRKKGESLVINNNIEITVLEIRGDQIKIGITAPNDVPIYRKEVYLQIDFQISGFIYRQDVIYRILKQVTDSIHWIKFMD